MMTLHTDQTFRACSRCGKELTDPASRECGVGPICRGKDNHLYAKTIQANLPAASAIVLGTTPEQFPEAVQGLWGSFRESFIQKMARTEQQTDLLFTGADFRDDVRILDLMLSYRLPHNLKERVVKVVRHLGYPGLAAVLSGEASTTKAKIYFEGGRLFLEGRSNKYGWRTMRRIPGITTPRHRGDRTPYTAPASQAEAFIDAVMAHWPLYEGDLDQIREHAAAYAVGNPEAPVPVECGPRGTITVRSEDVTVKTDWVNEVRAMVQTLKADIPSRDRRWDPAAKAWTIKLTHLDKVKALLRGVYGEAVTVVESGEATPAGLYASRSSGRRYSRSRYYRGGYYGRY